MNLRYMSWGEFDYAIEISTKPVCRSLYPVMRGGLVYAVALSHKFDLPIVTKPDRYSVLVDDIADSGKTITGLRFKHGNMPAHVLYKRTNCFGVGIHPIYALENDDWIVFPWESKEKAENEYYNYLQRK